MAKGVEFKRPPIVEVEWIDATGKEKTLEWTSKTDAEGWLPASCYSVGYLVSDNDIGVRLAQDIAFNANDPTEEYELNGLDVIPRGCVVHVKVLRK